MSSEQEQFESRLSDLLGDIHMDSVSTTTTTEEEEIDQQLLATLERKLGQIHNDPYKEANALLSVAAEESTDEDMMKRLSELLGSIHMDTVPTNEEEESNNYMIRKALGGLHMPGDHQVEKKKDPLYYVVRKFIVLSNVVGVTPEGESVPVKGSAVYETAARLLNTGESANQLHSFWRTKGRASNNPHYVGQYSNQIHPYLKVSGEDDVHLRDCIRVLNSLREELTNTCPWMNRNPALRVAFIPSVEGLGFDWINQITDPEKKKVIQKVTRWREQKTREKVAQEKVLVLELQAGLLTDWNQYTAKVQEWLSGDENEEGLLIGYIRWAFFKWAGVTDLSQWRGIKDIGVTETQMKDWFEEYKRNPIVERFIEETDQIADDSAKLIREALPYLERINQHYTNKRHAKNGEKGYLSRVYTGEKYNRVNINNEVVPNTLPSGEEVPSSEELAYELFYQLHHCTIGDVDGKARKRETRVKKHDGTEGRMKNPVEYTRDEMNFQNPGMRLVSEYYHALVDKKQKSQCLTKHLRHGMTDKLVLEHNNNKCLVNAKHVADTTNLRAFHSHHLTLGYNTKIGSSILETMKMSGLATMKQKVTSPKKYPQGHLKRMNQLYQLIENLFPELIITRLLDCRYHHLCHYLLNNPGLMKELNLEFPYEFDEKRNLMICTRTKVDDEEKEVLKLPSVMEVLQIEGDEAKGVCRQSYAKKGIRMSVGDEDSDFGESDTDSDSELE